MYVSKQQNVKKQKTTSDWVDRLNI